MSFCILHGDVTPAYAYTAPSGYSYFSTASHRNARTSVHNARHSQTPLCVKVSVSPARVSIRIRTSGVAENDRPPPSPSLPRIIVHVHRRTKMLLCDRGFRCSRDAIHTPANTQNIRTLCSTAAAGMRVTRLVHAHVTPHQRRFYGKGMGVYKGAVFVFQSIGFGFASTYIFLNAPVQSMDSCVQLLSERVQCGFGARSIVKSNTQR
jgi:hypothetical protein